MNKETKTPTPNDKIDLKFLKEMRTYSLKSLDNNDRVSKEMLNKMIEDWIDELEQQPKVISNDKIEEIMKEFYNRFVEPIDSQMRAKNLNNEPCVMGTWKDVGQFLKQSLLSFKSEVDKEWREKIQERIVLLYKQEEELQEQYLHKDAISNLNQLLK